MTSLRNVAARLVVVVVCSASALTAQHAEDALVSRLIVAAGAPASAPAAQRAVEWRGTATVAAGGRTLQIGGLPPEAHAPRTP